MLVSDNGITLDNLTPEQLDKLDRMQVIYRCNDSECCTNYYLTPGLDWCDLGLALIQIEMEDRSGQ